MLGMVKFADALLVLLRLCCFCCLQFRYLPYTSFFFFFFFFFFSFFELPIFVSCKGCDPRGASMQTSRALPTHPIVLIDDDLDLYSQAGSSMSSPFVF